MQQQSRWQRSPDELLERFFRNWLEKASRRNRRSTLKMACQCSESGILQKRYLGAARQKLATAKIDAKYLLDSLIAV
jgi:hypothetical protein